MGTHAEQRREPRDELAPVPSARASKPVLLVLTRKAFVEIRQQRLADVVRGEAAQPVSVRAWRRHRYGRVFRAPESAPPHSRAARACSRRTYSRPAAVSR